MSDHLQGTVLSGQSTGSAGTVLSGQASGSAGTVLSSQASDIGNWPPGLLLKQGAVVEGYTIVGFINKSGEAELYKGVKDGKEYAVKIYLNQVSLKQEVVEKLVGKQFRNLAYMMATGETSIEFRAGEFLRKAYEVSPLYQVVKKPLPYNELINMIKHINEGLNELHEMGIFHKDIKPANIMQDSDGVYRVIDFGISSVAMKGQTSINNTITGISFDYASPDARATAKASSAEDYYSFGISIYEYFTGELPYAELGTANDRYLQLNSVGIKVRESLQMPQDLVKLIHGLTYYSNNSEQNKRRWGYEQVKQWLENPDELEDLDMEVLSGGKSSVSGANVNSGATTIYPKKFGFAGGQLSDSYSLADALGSHWGEGLKLVGRGYLGDFFKENGSEFVNYRSACEDTTKALEDAKTTLDENVTYWKLLYQLEPKLTKFYWCEAKPDGRTDYTCEELGVYFFLQPMKNRRDNKLPQVTGDIIASGLLPVYLKNHCKDEEKYNRAVKLLDEFKKQEDEKHIWKLGYLLTGKAVFRYRNQDFEHKEDLLKYIVDWTNSLSRDEALAVVRSFENTKEFQAWIESQGE